MLNLPERETSDEEVQVAAVLRWFGEEPEWLLILDNVDSEEAEAEPLMRRVVAIWESSLGEHHPKVATAINNLAQLLQATNRLGEAEPLMRWALEIVLEFERRTGFEHPNRKLYSANYRNLWGTPMMRWMRRHFRALKDLMPF